jgi:hypothetical protein
MLCAGGFEMRRFFVLGLVGFGLALLLPASEALALTKCRMNFELRGWSFVYRNANGTGTVTCGNGQSADVRLTLHAGGFTAGKFDILNGQGAFSEVKDISEIFGTYVVASGHAGATKAVSGWAMTKGEVSLAISGEGRGWTLGGDIGGFTIKRR